MIESKKLLESLEALAKKEIINIIIESGTYLGTGSTIFLAKAFHSSSAFEKLYTCEVNHQFYHEAKKNLKPYSNVICINGRTISIKEANKFIATDEVLENHKDYPNIYIDDIENPKQFYLQELNGNLGGKHNTIWENLKNFFNPLQDELLKKLIVENINKKILIVLDSAGGIGYLEFLIVNKLLSHKEYYILLDDIHHLKHFRSFQYIQNHKNFELISFDILNGWALAKHLGTS